MLREANASTGEHDITDIKEDLHDIKNMILKTRKTDDISSIVNNNQSSYSDAVKNHSKRHSMSHSRPTHLSEARPSKIRSSASANTFTESNRSETNDGSSAGDWTKKEDRLGTSGRVTASGLWSAVSRTKQQSKAQEKPTWAVK